MQTASDSSPLMGRKLSDLVKHDEDDPDELLKYRFLCREGTLGLYGQTGIGKSSLAMQLMILWSLEREAFGFIPTFPLKSVLIQAENDDGDIAEMRDGIVKGLELTPDDKRQACDNIFIHQEDSMTGAPFFSKVVEPLLQAHKPDILWIDPALAYLDGDTLSQKDVGKFLRIWLKPIIKRHRCGCVIIHHTNKTGSNDTAYAGSGSSEWGNAPRGVITLNEKGGGVFELKATKRDKRLRWKTADRKSITDSKHLKHSIVEGQIFWIEDCCAEYSVPPSNEDKTEEGILQSLPQTGTIAKEELIRKAMVVTGIGQNKVRKRVQQLLTEQKIFESDKPRATARPEKRLSRQRPPGLSEPVADGVANGHTQPSSTTS